MPLLSLSYTTGLHNTYYDSQNTIQNGSGQYSQQTYWRYLSKYVDTLTGVGGTVSYNTAYSNTHGTPNDTDSNGNLDDRYDPLHCSLFSDCTGNYLHPDDHAWSVQVVTSITALGSDSSSLSAAKTTYSYRLAKTGTYSGNPPYYCYPAGSDSDCVGDNWIVSSDNNWQDYYDAEFRGFNSVTIAGPASGEERVDSYYSTKGWNTASSDGSNYDSGHLYEEDVYGIYGGTQEVLLSITQNQYTGSCPLSNANCTTTLPNACNGTLNAYYNPCEVMVTASRTTTYDTTARTNSNAPWVENDNTYDDYTITSSNASGLGNGYHNLTQQVVSSSNAPKLTQSWTYWANDSGEPGSGWIDYTVDQVKSSQITDASSTVWQCQNFSYDQGASSTPDAGWLTTATSASNCANQSGTAISSYLGYDQYGNLMGSVDGIGVANPSLYSSNGCSFGSGQGTIKIMSSSWTASHYTTCSTYTDGGSTNIYESVPLTQTNAFGFQGSISYDYTQAALPLSSTDINAQTSSLAYSFDSNSASNGKYTSSLSQPGETGGYTTQSNSFSQCSTSSTLPCFEIDSATSQYSSAITRTFYDSLGREVETRTPGPGSYDSIVFALYNDQNHSVLTSVPFQVASGSSWIDPIGAKDYNGNTPGGTAVYYDTLGRPLAYQDPTYGSAQEPGHACSSYLGSTYSGCTNYTLDVSHVSGDSNTYQTVTSVDANDHVAISSLDALGRTRYTQIDSGVHSNPSTLMGNERETYQYNVLNEATSVTDSDLVPQSTETVTSVTTTASYDSMGRMTQLVDPERGTHTYTYDAHGHLITDVSGSRTLGYSYDLLGRLGCLQDVAPTLSATGACTSGSNPFVINTYDADPSGVSWGSTNYAKGQLTQSFAITYYPGPDDTQGKVTENMQYDTRGRLTTERMQLTATGGSLTFPSFPTYQMALSYNDANQLVTTTTSSNPSGLGYTTTNVYDSTDNLSGLSNNSTQTANLATLNYSTHAQVSQINFLTSNGSSQLANEQFTYDADLRPLTASAVWLSGSGTSGGIYSQTLTYDPVGNVASSSTTQAVVSGANNSGGSENEIYCYEIGCTQVIKRQMFAA